MKYCKDCNKVYQDNAQYCALCGKPLEKVIEYDIFGEPMDKKETPNFSYTNNNYSHNAYRDYRGNNGFAGSRQYTEEEIKNKRCKNGEMFGLISIGVAFVPVYGLILCIFSLIKNINVYREYKKNLGYLILSAVMVVISAVFFYLLYRYGVLSDIISQSSSS